MPASDSFQSDGSEGRPVTVIVPVSPMAVGVEGSALTGRYDRVLPGDLLNRVCVRCGAEGTEAGRLRCGKRLSRPFKMFLIGVPLIVVAGTVAMVLAGQGFWDVFLLPVVGFGFWTIGIGKWFQAGRYWEQTRFTFFMCPECLPRYQRLERRQRSAKRFAVGTAIAFLAVPCAFGFLTVWLRPGEPWGLVGAFLFAATVLLLPISLVALGVVGLQAARFRRLSARWLEREHALELRFRNPQVAGRVPRGSLGRASL